MTTQTKGLVLLVGIAATLVVGVAFCARPAAPAPPIAALQAAQNGLRVALADATIRDKKLVAAEARADSLGQIVVQTTQHVRILSDSLPKVQAALDSVLTDSTQRTRANAVYAVAAAQTDSLTQIVQTQTHQIGLLHAALDSARATVDTVAHAARTVSLAATAILPAPEGFFTKLSPNAGIGVAIGVDQAGHPAVVAGLVFSWPHRP